MLTQWLFSHKYLLPLPRKIWYKISKFFIIKLKCTSNFMLVVRVWGIYYLTAQEIMCNILFFSFNCLLRCNYHIIHGICNSLFIHDSLKFIKKNQSPNQYDQCSQSHQLVTILKTTIMKLFFALACLEMRDCLSEILGML